MPQKTEKTKIRSCGDLLEWVGQLGVEGLLFRGVSDSAYHSAESSIIRRLRPSVDKDANISREQFIDACKKLLSGAKMRGYNVKNGVEQGELELLANLQHFGAATCLVDFTKNPLIALWFACRKHDDKDGKIAAFNPNSGGAILVQPGDLGESIDVLLSPEKVGINEGKTIRVWEPKHQNKRIPLQQSVFVFGEPEIKILEERIVPKDDKQNILQELRRLGIAEESMFPDFDGYARILNAHDRPFFQSGEERAAKQGTAEAQHNLGLKYYNGEGVDKDDREAVKWFRLAAEQGFARAQTNLGVMYYNGYGVDKDDREAVEWFLLAAEQKFARAQFSLGVMYQNGEGVDKDDREAAKWFLLAAEQGFTRARFNLGMMYANGEGVDRNLGEAAKWYRLAAEQGDASAQNNLGVMYWKGEGVIEDKREAYIWYSIAKANGEENAANSLRKNLWNEHFTEADIKSAKQEAASRLAKIRGE